MSGGEERARRIADYDLAHRGEGMFGDVVALAVEVTGAHAAMVSLLAGDEWTALSALPMTSADHSFCAAAMRTPDRVLVVPDARRDPRFAACPSVAGSPGVRFYAGAPLVTPDGIAVGTLCVMDSAPREVAPSQVAALRALARQAVRELESERRLRGLARLASSQTPSPTALEALVDGAPAAIYVKDGDGRYLLVNDTFERVTGVTRDRALGHSDAELLPPEHVAQYVANDREVLRTGRPIGVEEFVMDTEGNRRTYLSAKFPLGEWAGASETVCGISVEITDRRRAEIEAGIFRAAELVDIFDRISDGVIVLDEEWRCSFVNEPGARLLGRARDELIGRGMFEAFPEGASGPFVAHYERALSTQRAVSVEEYFEPWGRWFENRVYPWPHGLVIFFTDITGRKRAERELERTVEQLEELAANRRALLGRVLQAEEAERRSIAEGIHDETVQVLSAARLQVDLLAERVEGEDTARERLSAIRDALQRATSQLRTLIFELRPVSLDHSGLAVGVREYAGRRFQGAPVRWRVEDALDREPADGPRAVAYRIVVEALNNVARHAGECSVRVELASAEGRLEVAVSDDGAGFDPGREDVPGHLGLPAMRERAEVAGGTLEVTSAPGRGTRVACTLPLNGGG